jgi:hypothetical protein
MPKSKRLWLQAAKREEDSDPLIRKRRKRELLAKALEHIPEEIEIWRLAMELEDEEGKKSLLYRAVESIPHST